MKSYLEFVPISAKEHGKQNRMAVCSIALAVFLVTVIFGMADMFIRSQVIQAEKEYGNFHFAVRGISNEQAEAIEARSDVNVVSCYGALNYRGEDGYTLGNKSVVVCGSDEAFLTQIQTGMIAEGRFPQTTNEALVTLNARDNMGLTLGAGITVQTPDGSSHSFTISGFLHNAAMLMSEDFYGIFLTMQGYRSLYSTLERNLSAEDASMFYVQLSTTRNVQKSMDDIVNKLNLSDGHISGNTKLLALLGQGADSLSLQIYGTAAILFVLVLLAGIMMIASSLNSNVVGRTQFFGMMRCIGASKKQIRNIVRLEALSWCALAIPLGVAVGVIIIWGLCYALRMLAYDYFGNMPAFAISVPSILAGVIVGLLTVLLAAQAPAKRASKASPLAAVSSGFNVAHNVKKAANVRRFKIEAALGIRHAVESKKNYFLMSASFALSIVLFLSFSVAIAFMGHALKPLRPWTPDLSVSSQSDDALIPASLLDTLIANPAVEKAYGRMAISDCSVTLDGEPVLVHLISYEEMQFGWAEKYVLAGSVERVYEQPGTGMAVYDKNTIIPAGSTLVLDADEQKKVTIAGVLSDSPFRINEGAIVICSEQTLQQLGNMNGYAVIDIQLKNTATDQEVEEIRAAVGDAYTFSDERLSNSSVAGSYYSFSLFIYGFLALIALVTVCNIVNAIAMSVTSRTKQYGVFRAIGLSTRQLLRTVLAEAVTYVCTGAICGTAIGIGLNWLLFTKLISFNWGDAWRFPVGELGVILGVIGFSLLISVRGPVNRIGCKPIVDSINAQSV